MPDPLKERWYAGRNEELMTIEDDTREAVIERGIEDFDGEPFIICKGKPFEYAAIAFDSDRIKEDFDDLNYEYGPEDGPSQDWTDPHMRELETELTRTMAAWLERHGYHKAWALNTSANEFVNPADL